MIFFTAACSSSLKDKKALGGKVYGGEFTFYSQEPINIFFPFYSTSGYDQRVLSQIFEPLFSVDENGLIVQQIASNYQVLSKGKKIRITIHRGIHFHQDACFDNGGDELSAEDVKFSLDFACSGNRFNTLSKFFVNKIVGAKEFNKRTKNTFDQTGVSGIRVINDSVIDIQLNTNYSHFQKLLAHPSLAILSKKAYNFYKSSFVKHPIGTGAFQLKFTSEQKTVLTRNPNYWKKDEFGNQLPFLEKVNIIHSNSLRKEHDAFSKGKVDIIFELPTESLENAFGSLSDAQKGKNLLHRFVLRKGVKMNYLSFDFNQYPFNNENVRKAISLAINREQICMDELNGEGDYKINGVVPRNYFYTPNSKPLIYFNPVQARILMQKSGFNAKNKFPRLKLYANVRKGSLDDKWVKALVKQLKENLDINLDLIYCSLREKHQAIASGKAKLWKSSWSSDYPDADSYFSIFTGNKNKESFGNNYFGSYSSALFDEIYRKSEQTTGSNERHKLLNKLDEILMNKAAIIPVFSDDLYVIVNLRVRNFNINNAGIIDFSTIYIKGVS